MTTGATPIARRLDRIPTNTPVTLQFESQGQSHHQRARLLDISDTGMRLKATVALGKGQEVQILSQYGMQEPERTRVVWVREEESEPGYLIGVEILNPHLMNPTAMPSEMVSRRAKDTTGAEDETRKVVGDDRGPMSGN